MAKTVFRPGEVALIDTKVVLDAPASSPGFPNPAQDDETSEEEPEAPEVYLGPTADDLHREAEQFKAEWEKEKEAMMVSSKAEAELIVKEAEDAASKEIERGTGEAQDIKRRAEDEAKKITAEAAERVKQMEAESRATLDNERKDALDQGHTEGREAGYVEGKAEVERLIQRTQTVLQRAQDKRTEILQETEQEIINLVLIIARKVVKAITESQRTVIISNVIQALRKVKGRGNIIIRVNLADLKLTTAHTKDFISLVEGAKSLQVVEDSTVDEGGCVIETDFGEIDARITSQLGELEAKILELSPIRSTPKAEAAGV
ncbi:MAG: flagellar assembly protein FliH [Treponema sp.]|jgi:flagellar assembly protein FliH|nr:flagellar assembly protein FliH [Treponema sp.]